MNARSYKTARVIAAAALGALLAASGSLSAQTRDVNPSPHELLRKAAAYLNSAANLEIEAQVEYDHFLTPSLLVAYTGKLHVKMSRPDRLFVGFQDRLVNRRLWIDGGDVTYLDVVTKHYSKEHGKKTIAETLAELHGKYGLSLPLANLLFSDSFARISGKTHAIDYLGKLSMGNTTVHHVVAHGEFADIQVWIDDGDAPVIRKILVINHGRPFAPRYSARFIKVGKPESFPNNTFSPDLPEKSRQTKMISIEGKNANAH
jgi:hypothetical protein